MITFKDSDGVEVTLLVARMACADGIRVYPHTTRAATDSDLTRAGFIQLSTGSDGPTDEELESLYDVEMPKVVNWRRIYLAGRAVGLVRLLGEHPTVGEVLVLDDRSALFAAGSASRQAEVDRLTARVAELEALNKNGSDEYSRVTKALRAERNVAESELAATKEKLAEAERERDEATGKLANLSEGFKTGATVALKLAHEKAELGSELERTRRVVEAALEVVESAWSLLYEVGEDSEDTSRVLDLLTRVTAKLRYETAGHSEDCALRMENCDQCTCEQALASAGTPAPDPRDAELERLQGIHRDLCRDHNAMVREGAGLRDELDKYRAVVWAAREYVADCASHERVLGKGPVAAVFASRRQRDASWEALKQALASAAPAADRTDSLEETSVEAAAWRYLDELENCREPGADPERRKQDLLDLLCARHRAREEAAPDADRTEAPKCDSGHEFADGGVGLSACVCCGFDPLSAEPPRAEAGETCSECDGDGGVDVTRPDIGNGQLEQTIPCPTCRPEAGGSGPAKCAITGEPCGTETNSFGHVCPCVSCVTWLTINSVREEPKPEPQLSGEDPAHDLPWRIGRGARGDITIEDSSNGIVAHFTTMADAALCIARCNAQDEGLAERIAVLETALRLEVGEERFAHLKAALDAMPGQALRPELRDSPAAPQDDDA